MKFWIDFVPQSLQQISLLRSFFKQDLKNMANANRPLGKVESIMYYYLPYGDIAMSLILSGYILFIIGCKRMESLNWAQVSFMSENDFLQSGHLHWLFCIIRFVQFSCRTCLHGKYQIVVELSSESLHTEQQRIFKSYRTYLCELISVGHILHAWQWTVWKAPSGINLQQSTIAMKNIFLCQDKTQTAIISCKLYSTANTIIWWFLCQLTIHTPNCGNFSKTNWEQFFPRFCPLIFLFVGNHHYHHDCVYNRQHNHFAYICSIFARHYLDTPILLIVEWCRGCFVPKHLFSYINLRYQCWF